MIQVSDDEMLTDVLLGDEFLVPVMNSVFDFSTISPDGSRFIHGSYSNWSSS